MAMDALPKMKKLAQEQAWRTGGKHLGGRNLQRANQWVRHHLKLDTQERHREADGR